MNPAIRYLLTILFATVLGFISLLSIKYYFSHHLANSSVGINGLKALGESPDILFVGSSHVRQSYNIETVESETKMSAFALAYNGQSPHLIYPLLEYVLNSGVKPRLLVMEAYTYSTIRPPRLQDTRLFFDAPPTLKSTLLQTLHDIDGGFHWSEQWSLLVNANNEQILTFPITNAIIDRGSYKGGYKNKKTPELSAKDFIGMKPPVSGGKQDLIVAQQKEALVKIFQLIKKHNIDAIFVESPLPSVLEADPMTKHNKQLLRGLIENNGFTYVDGVDYLDESIPQHFADDNHLSTTGRDKYSENFAKFIPDYINNINALTSKK